MLIPIPRAARRALSAVLTLSLLVAEVAHCGPARNGLMNVTPGVPASVGCTAGAGRCSGRVPEVCSATGRWWPALPRDAYGAQRACVGACGVTDAGVPYCMAVEDAGADASGDVE